MSERQIPACPKQGLGSHGQLQRTSRSAPFLAFVLRDPRLHQFLHKCSRQWLVRREVDGPFGCGEALKLALERLYHGRSREQTTVVRKRGEPHQRSIVFECRYPAADGFGSLRWHSGPNRSTNLVQSASGKLRDASKVFVDGAPLPLAAELRFPDFTFFMREMLREAPIQVHASTRRGAARRSYCGAPSQLTKAGAGGSV
jgi:hypothetical protein